jgi:hypothetical protein
LPIQTVKRKSQGGADLSGQEAVEEGRGADAGEGDLLVWEKAGSGQKIDGLENGREVVEGFAHAHEHNAFGGVSRFAGFYDLAADFEAAQVTFQAILTCLAEPATHGATDLG